MKKTVKGFCCILLVILLCFTSVPTQSNMLARARSDKYNIYGRSFDKNFDYFTAKTNSTSYSPELANMTAAMSKAVYEEADIKNAFASLGFGADDYVYYDYNGELEPYKCCHAIGFKKSDYGSETVCLVVVRGTEGNLFSSDWIGNYSITVTEDGNHSGFSNAADYLYANIKKIMNEKNITGKVKYVLTGHSRGGAIAQLLSVKLMNNGIKAADVFNYNFAIPNVARKTTFGSYNNIFNLCNSEDPVPFLPDNLEGILNGSGEIWGKFGRTYWFSKEYEGKIIPLYNHDMGLYLEYFDNQPELSELDSSSEDDNVFEIENGWAVRIQGAADVVITDGNGSKMVTVKNGEAKYEPGFLGDIMVKADSGSMIIYINGDLDFDVSIVGRKNSIASYSVEKYNYITSAVLESKTFNGISISKGKEFYSVVRTNKSLNDVKLYVVETYNGVRINGYEVNTDGTEKEIRHVYTTEKTEPTCTEEGYTVFTCLHCDGSYRDEFVPAEGHSYEGSVCTVCGYDRAVECDHLCHSTGFLGFVWKVILFFCSLLNLDPVCDCGMAHY
ncbi:MAG: DUF2974 domain-containing protein [Clostridia bacterium]|nr:DUF2974 domain-containing protein [Clostridia bacterium]